MPRARAERMTEIQTDPIEAKAPVRSEAANDNANVTEITSADIVGETRSAKVKPAEKAFDMAAIKEKARTKKKEREERLAEAAKETSGVTAEALAAGRDTLRKKQLQKEAGVLDISRERASSMPPEPTLYTKQRSRRLKENLDATKKAADEALAKEIYDQMEVVPPQPTAEQLKKSREQKKEVDLAKAKAKAKEIFDKMDAFPEKDLVVTDLSEAPLTDVEVATLTPKRERKAVTNADIKRGYGGKDRLNPESGLGLYEKGWLEKGVKMSKPGRQESSKETKVRDARERNYDQKLEKQKTEEKASIAQAKPSFWQRFKGVFGGPKKSTFDELEDLSKSLSIEDGKSAAAPEKAQTASVVEQRESKSEPVSMSAILDHWNKDYAKRGVRLVLDKLPNDGRDMVNTSVTDIVGRLEQRLQAQLRKNNVSGYEYNTNIKPLLDDLATTLVQKGERELQYKQRSYPEFRKKAA